MNALLARICKLAEAACSPSELEKVIVAALAAELPHYNWTGFYWLDPNDPQLLVLGAFAGEPTPHVRIPVSEGICGAAVAAGVTVVVDDVSADPRYLSCSIRTKSEIVVPIYAQGEVVGEIDIDSHSPAAFTEIDRAFLEEVARIVGSYIEGRVEGSHIEEADSIDYSKSVASKASTSSRIAAGTLSSFLALRTPRSTGRGWSQRTTPVVRVPAPVNETVNPATRAKFPPAVMGTTIGARVSVLNPSGETTRTGRVPCCS